MRVIQNEMVAFRCPNTLKERLNEIALTSDMHVSQVVRMACAELVSRRAQAESKSVIEANGLRYGA